MFDFSIKLFNNSAFQKNNNLPNCNIINSNCMKRILFIGLFLLSISLTAQTYRYTQVNQLAVQQNNYTIVNHNFGFYAIANAIQSFTNAWSDNKKREIEVQKSQFRIEQVKETYRVAKSYPESILDG